MDIYIKIKILYINMEFYLNFMKPLPNIYELQSLFFDEKLCTEYLIAKGIIPHKARCPKCRQFTLKIKKDIKNYECRNVSCRKSLCIKKNTFFQDKNLKLGQILLLGLL